MEETEKKRISVAGSATFDMMHDMSEYMIMIMRHWIKLLKATPILIPAE